MKVYDFSAHLQGSDSYTLEDSDLREGVSVDITSMILLKELTFNISNERDNSLFVSQRSYQ